MFALAMEKTKKSKVTREQIKELVYFARFIKPYTTQFVLGLVLLFFSSVIVMAFPYLAGELADIATGKSKLHLTLDQVGGILLLILVLQGVVSYVRVILFTIFSEKSMADVRVALYQKLITLPVVFYDKNRVGELISRITADVDQLQQVLSVTMAEFIRQILILIVGITLLLVSSPRLSLLMLATFPLIVIAAFFFGRFIRRLSKERQEKLAATNTVVDETLQTIHTVKSFTNEWFEFGRYRDKIQEVVQTALHLAKYRASFGSFVIVVLFGGIFFLLWFGARMVQDGSMTVGQLVAFIAYTMFIGGAIGSLGNFYTTIISAVGGTERIREILNHDVEVSTQRNTKRPPVVGNIRFEEVEFSYPTRSDVPVLKGINMEIAAGHKIALVGTSGAGKSTIAQLLLRFYEPTGGAILLDDQRISGMPLESYRSILGLVPQEVILFGGTIRENILYGNPDATEDQLIEAARQANAWEFIKSFPDGLETRVGERGIKLSGGQRQRIAIARAILRDPKILILDEATSSLDAESERVVQEALDNLMQGRTSVIIAHRLATIKEVDCIYVIEHGKVIEKGTHEELAAIPDGAYSSFAKLQFDTSE
ncbi:MAG: ATP-binding cassette domain-containing protein [Saprospiraceae bacterium]|nr:ATP-binding cassette domain-containing protein [Saprospiraceae bacterium]